MRFLFLIAAMVLAATPSFALNWSKCKKGVYKPLGKKVFDPKGNWGKYAVGFTLQISSEMSTQSSTSTTSYVSSTGDCRAFGMAEQERFKYIAQVYTELQMEAAEGQGEHVTSLATLYGCSAKVRPQFNEMLKANHSKIFDYQPMQNAADVTEHITDTVINNEVLAKNCNLEKI